MTKLRILVALLCCLPLWAGSAWGDDDFNPSNPPEPATIDYCRLKVSADPAEAAYVSGSGKYSLDYGSVYVSASERNTSDYEYVFQYWEVNGVKSGYSKDFYFTCTGGTFNLVAHFEKREVVFEPDSPDEPSSSNIKRKYYLYLTTNLEGACSFNMASGVKHEEGSSFYLYANVTPGYEFECWKANGNVVSYSKDFYYTMPSANTTLECCMKEIPFDPDSPLEPSGDGSNVDNTGRQVIDVWIGSGNTQVDKTRVVFNKDKTTGYDTGTDASKFISTDADYQIYTIDDDGKKYSINERPVGNGEIPVGIIVKKAGETTITATRLDCSIALKDKKLGRTVDLGLCSYTFTSAAGTFEDRFVLTTSIPPLLMGDVNGDGVVSITDAVGVVNKILGNPSKNFIEAAADINGDGKVSITDAVGIVNIILGAK